MLDTHYNLPTVRVITQAEAKALLHDSKYQNEVPPHYYIESRLSYNKMNYVMLVWHDMKEDTRWIDAFNKIAEGGVNPYIMMQHLSRMDSDNKAVLEKLKQENKVYISGPMTGMGDDFNYGRFCEIENILSEHGVRSFNPASRGRQAGWKHNHYLKDDIRYLSCMEDKITAVVKMDGWNNSIGAWEEVKLSRMLYKMNIYYIDKHNNIHFSL